MPLITPNVNMLLINMPNIYPEVETFATVIRTNVILSHCRFTDQWSTLATYSRDLLNSPFSDTTILDSPDATNYGVFVTALPYDKVKRGRRTASNCLQSSFHTQF